MEWAFGPVGWLFGFVSRDCVVVVAFFQLKIHEFFHRGNGLTDCCLRMCNMHAQTTAIRSHIHVGRLRLTQFPSGNFILHNCIVDFVDLRFGGIASGNASSRYTTHPKGLIRPSERHRDVRDERKASNSLWIISFMKKYITNIFQAVESCYQHRRSTTHSIFTLDTPPLQMCWVQLLSHSCW